MTLAKFDLKNELTIIEGTLKDYLTLDYCHYLNTPLPPYKHIYIIRPKMYVDGSYKKLNTFAAAKHAWTIACIVYSCPLRDLHARTEATHGFFKQPNTLSDRLKLINKHILYVSRLVVDPRYRRQGLGDWLWRETLKLQTVPVIESLTTMPVREPWLKGLGFKIFYNPPPQSIRKLRKAFRKAHLSGSCLTVPEVAQKRIDALNKNDKFKLDRSLHHFLSNYRAREHMPDNVDRMIYILSKIPYPNAYLICFNPHVKENPVLDWINRKKQVESPLFWTG